MKRNTLLFWFAKKYRHNTVPRWYILALDLFTLVVAFAITEIVRLHTTTHIDWPSLVARIGAMAMAATVAYLLVGTYRSIIRHTGMYDLYKILLSNVLAAGVLVLFNLFNNSHHWLPSRYTASYSELLMTFALQITAMLMVRLMMQRVYNDYVRRRRPTDRVIIYGAGAAGTITYNALMQDQLRENKVVAYIDDNPSKKDTALNGVHVMPRRAVLNPSFVKKNKVRTLILAMPSASKEMKHQISEEALDLGLVVKSVPHIKNWINDSFSVGQIESIRIEDLLDRDSISLDKANIMHGVADKVVLVTGAAGSIGSEICRQLTQYCPSQIVMLDQAETPMYDLRYELLNSEPYRQLANRMSFVIVDVNDTVRLKGVFEQYRPNIVYHAAAYKHVPMMEENPYEALLVNVQGTRNVADFSMEFGVDKFVMISTDKAVNPTNVMGASKRLAEIYIQSRPDTPTHFVTTRFGNVLGSNGSVIPLFKKQLAAGGPLTVTHHDIIRYFMTVPEACNLVLEAGAMGNGGDIFVFDMGSPVRIYDLARKMIQLSGMKNIEIVETGLRPGEKLYEELLADKENTLPTYHPKIMRAKVRTYSAAEVDRSYAELFQLLPTLDYMSLVSKMKEIVPEFKSQNSIYAQLDKEGES